MATAREIYLKSGLQKVEKTTSHDIYLKSLIRQATDEAERKALEEWSRVAKPGESVRLSDGRIVSKGGMDPFEKSRQEGQAWYDSLPVGSNEKRTIDATERDRQKNFDIKDLVVPGIDMPSGQEISRVLGPSGQLPNVYQVAFAKANSTDDVKSIHNYFMQHDQNYQTAYNAQMSQDRIKAFQGKAKDLETENGFLGRVGSVILALGSGFAGGLTSNIYNSALNDTPVGDAMKLNRQSGSGFTYGEMAQGAEGLDQNAAGIGQMAGSLAQQLLLAKGAGALIEGANLGLSAAKTGALVTGATFGTTSAGNAALGGADFKTVLEKFGEGFLGGYAGGITQAALNNVTGAALSWMLKKGIAIPDAISGRLANMIGDTGFLVAQTSFSPDSIKLYLEHPEEFLMAMVQNFIFHEMRLYDQRHPVGEVEFDPLIVSRNEYLRAEKEYFNKGSAEAKTELQKSAARYKMEVDAILEQTTDEQSRAILKNISDSLVVENWGVRMNLQKFGGGEGERVVPGGQELPTNIEGENNGKATEAPQEGNQPGRVQDEPAQVQKDEAQVAEPPPYVADAPFPAKKESGTRAFNQSASNAEAVKQMEPGIPPEEKANLEAARIRTENYRKMGALDYEKHKQEPAYRASINRVENDPEGTYLRWEQKFNRGTRFSADEIVDAMTLLDRYGRSGDARYDNLLGQIAMIGTENGQVISALGMYMKMTPEGFLASEEAVLRRMNAFGRQKYGDKWKDLVLTGSERQQITNATDIHTREAIAEQIKGRLVDEIPKTLGSKLDALRMMSMLLNPTTHLRNLAGNLIMAGMRRYSDAAGAILEKAILPGEKNKQYRRKAIIVKEEYKRLAENVLRSDQVQDMYKKLAGKYEGTGGAGDRTYKYTDKFGETGGFSVEHQVGKDTVRIVQSDGSSTVAPRSEVRKLIKQLRSEGKVVEVINGPWKNGKRELSIRRTLNKLARFTGESLNLEDLWFSEPAFKRSMEQLFAARGITDPSKITDDMIQIAMDYSLKATFRQFSTVANWIQKAKNWGGPMIVKRKGTIDVGQSLKNTLGSMMSIIAKAEIPFVKTPINIAKTGVEYSPLNVIKGLVEITGGKLGAREEGIIARAEKSGQDMTPEEVQSIQDAKGNLVAQGIENLAKGASGTSLLGAAILLAAQGFLTGKPDNDKEKAAYEKAVGQSPYALHIGDAYYRLDWLQPFMAPFMTGVAMYEAIKDKGLTIESLGDAGTAGIDQILQLPFMQGIQNTMQLMSNNDSTSSSLAKGAFSILDNYVKQFSPTVMGKLASTVDKNVRSTYVPDDKSLLGIPAQANRWFNYYISRTPGASFLLPKAYDIYGNEQLQQGQKLLGDTPEGYALNFFQSFLDPGSFSIEEGTKLNSEIEKVYSKTKDEQNAKSIFPSVPDRQDATFSVGGKQYVLTADEYSAYQKNVGSSTYKYMKSFIGDKAYAKLSYSAKSDVLQKAINMATAEARYKVQKGRHVSATNPIVPSALSVNGTAYDVSVPAYALYAERRDLYAVKYVNEMKKSTQYYDADEDYKKTLLSRAKTYASNLAKWEVLQMQGVEYDKPELYLD